MAGYTMVRLPMSVKNIFTEWLQKNRPEAAEKVLNYIMSTRDGKLNDANFGSRMRGQGLRADSIEKMFDVFCRKFGLNEKDIQLSIECFKRPENQLSFF